MNQEHLSTHDRGRQGKSLTVHVQMILDAGPATLSEEAAWAYIRDEALAIRRGDAGLEKLEIMAAVAQLWNVKHQRDGVLRRIARRLKAGRRRYNVFADAARAATGRLR